jgi:hypothetical protein
MIRLASFAALLAIAASLLAQSALDQLRAYKDGNAAPAQAAQQALAAAGARAQKYDILGIKVGMTIQEALASLKAYNANFRLKPQTIKYDVIPNPLTYGLWATSPNIYTGDNPVYDKVYKNASTDRLPPDSEQFYFLLAMPPSRPTVSKITRVIRWSLNTAPLQDILVGDLMKKYGSPIRDTGADKLTTNGSRDLVWIAGGRSGDTELLSCADDSRFITFGFSDSGGTIDGISLPPDAANLKLSLEKGYAQGYIGRDRCGQLTVIRARLYDTRRLRYPPTPNIVGGMAVMIGSGPMDSAALEATRAYLMQAAKDRDAKLTKAAEQNRPKQ